MQLHLYGIKNMIITLTPDLERTLTEQARKKGTTPEKLVLDSLRERFSPGLTRSAQSEMERAAALAELLRDHAGVLDSREYIQGGARMSDDTGRAFTEILVKNHRSKAE